MICFMHQGTPYGFLKVGSKVILPANLAAMVGGTLQEIEGWLEELESAEVFARDENGAIYSPRMIRDETLRQSRAEGGKKGGNPALVGGKDKAKVNLKDNRKQTPSYSASSSPSVSLSKNGEQGPPASSTSLSLDENDPSPDAFAFADWFRSLLPEGCKLATRWRENWAKCFDDMIRLDKRTPDEIRRVCEWARGDSFWSGNFLSPMKLRKAKDGVQYFDVFASNVRKQNPPPKEVIHYREKPVIIDASSPEAQRWADELERRMTEEDHIPF